MDKKRKAITLLLQIKELKKKLSTEYEYNSSLSREANLSAQEQFKKQKKPIKEEIDRKYDLAQKLTNEIKEEEKNKLKHPTGNVYEQFKEMKKAQSLYIK